VIHVAVRENRNIYFAEIDAEGLHVVLKTGRTVTRIKEDSFAVVMNQRRKPPVENCSFLLIAESVVEIQNGILVGGSQRAGGVV